MKLPIGLFVAALLLFMAGMVSLSEEVVVVSLIAGGASLVAYVAALKVRLSGGDDVDRLEARFAQLERRLSLTEGELEAANFEIQRLKTEREFDRQLLGGPPA